MARREKTVAITAEGRDRGKSFVIREMPADQGERWAYRALLALSRGGIELPPGLFERGWAGLAEMMPYFLVIGLRALNGAQWAEVEPLLEEMMACIQYKPPANAPLQQLFPGENCQIEEIATRAQLRKEVFQLHLNFSLAEAFPTTDPSPQSPPSA